MCDTIVATHDVTASGATLFAKNSDRQPNEAQHILCLPACDHAEGTRLRLTNIEIPQASHTHAVLLSKPFWMWGAEMGANEHGLAIGNEAVFTKIPYSKEPGMLGMDLLRLGLERGRAAAEALHVMTALLDQYGQGGNCGYEHPLYYHNSFLLADPHEAWLFETAGPHWAARQVHGVYSISNGLTIGGEWDLASPDLVRFAVDRGWCKGRDDFDFARCYSDFLYTRFSQCRVRSQRTRSRLSANQGRLTVTDLMTVLRDHGPQAGSNWTPAQGLTTVDVCMHSAAGPVRGDQSVASLVSQLHPQVQTHFFTGSAAPCTSLFKPIWLDAPPSSGLGPEPTGTYDPQTLFWRHETLHRATLRDYPNLLKLYQPERDHLEAEFVDQALAAAEQPAGERAVLSARCLEIATTAEARWLESIREAAPPGYPGWTYARAWNGRDQKARIPPL